jgi:hypothetical protein
VNRQNVRIWGSEYPHESFEHERGSPKVIVIAAMPREKTVRATRLYRINSDRYHLAGHVT